MNIALITGASSGLGAKYADTVIRKYPKLDEIWLVARREDRLEAYAAAHPEVRIRPVVLDLSADASYQELQEMLTEQKAVIRVLVNNAGYEKSGLLEDMDERDILAMIDLNVKGFTMVNRICLPFMRKGSIGLMTCSISSFTPVPNQAVYSASKAYVQYLSRALHEEVRNKGIRILMMCPGNMDTEMNPKGQGRQSSRINMLPFLDMNVITEKSLELAEHGKAVYTPGVFYKFYKVSSKLLPQALMTRIAAQSYK